MATDITTDNDFNSSDRDTKDTTDLLTEEENNEPEKLKEEGEFILYTDGSLYYKKSYLYKNLIYKLPDNINLVEMSVDGLNEYVCIVYDDGDKYRNHAVIIDTEGKYTLIGNINDKYVYYTGGCGYILECGDGMRVYYQYSQDYQNNVIKCVDVELSGCGANIVDSPNKMCVYFDYHYSYVLCSSENDSDKGYAIAQIALSNGEVCLLTDYTVTDFTKADKQIFYTVDGVNYCIHRINNFDIMRHLYECGYIEYQYIDTIKDLYNEPMELKDNAQVTSDIYLQLITETTCETSIMYYSEGGGHGRYLDKMKAAFQCWDMSHRVSF